MLLIEGRIKIARVILAGLVGLMLQSCTSANDRAFQAYSYPVGRTETELVKDAGMPAEKIALDKSNTPDFCKTDSQEPARWLLKYTVPSEGLAKSLRERIGMSPAIIIDVCIDRFGKVMATRQGVIN